MDNHFDTRGRKKNCWRRVSCVHWK